MPCVFLSLGAQAQYFIENKGQWPESVLFGAQIDGGMAFVEHDGVVFNLVSNPADSNNLKRQKEDHHHFSDKGKYVGHAFKLKFENALMLKNEHPADKKAGTYNYFLSENPSAWAKNCKGFSTLAFKNIIKGIDLQLFTQNNQLKWNFIAENPNAAKRIKWRYEGIKSKLNRNNVLTLKSGIGPLEEHLPEAYLTKDNKKIDVYYQENDGVFSLNLPDNLSESSSLIIDPVLVFSTFSGSTVDNFGYTATFDADGFLYSGSSVFGVGYPTTMGAYDETFNGLSGLTDIGISKFDTSGTFLIYSTYLGGRSVDLPHSILANANGELYILGSTSSDDFPVTPNAAQSTFGGGPATSASGLAVTYSSGADLIVSMLSSDGSQLLGSTYLGGSNNDGFITNTSQSAANNPCVYNYADEVRGEIEFDKNGDILIASSTYSNDFPFVGAGSYQSNASGNSDGIIVKMKPNLDVLWATYLGGDGYDAAFSIQPNQNNNYVVAGGSNTDVLPFVQGGFQEFRRGGRNDGYIAILNSTGTQVLHGTHYGYLAYDQIYFVDINSNDEILVFGQTEDEVNSFIFGGTGYADNNSGLFISKFDATLNNLIWSTTIGSGTGAPNLSPTAFLSDVCDRIFISGWGGLTAGSSSYPQNRLGLTSGLKTTANGFQRTTDGSDVYFAIYDGNMDSLLYASFFGGPNSREHVDGGTSRFDRQGIIYQAVCAGCGRNSDFPIEPNNAVSSTNNSNNCNLGVFKFDPELETLIADFRANGPYCGNDVVNFTNLSKNFKSAEWDFGDGNTSILDNPTHVYPAAGEYDITLVVKNDDACNVSDTIRQTIVILPDDIINGFDTVLCSGQRLDLDFSNAVDINALFTFSPSTGNANEQFGQYSTIADSSNFSINVQIEIGSCIRDVDVNVNVINLNPLSSSDSLLCSPQNLDLIVNHNASAQNIEWSNRRDFSNILPNFNDSTLRRFVNKRETIYVRVQTEACTLVDSIQFEILTSALRLGDDIIVCGDEESVDINPVLSSILENAENISFSWSPDSLVAPDSTARNVSVSTFDTTYTLTVSNGICSAVDSIRVMVTPFAKDSVGIDVLNADTVLGIYNLGVLTSDSSRRIVWTPSELFQFGNVYSQEVEILEETWVYLRIEEGECIRNDSILLFPGTLVCGPPNIFVPTAFSPNGDGNNDLLQVRGQLIESMHLEIFDQWGQKVFESKNQDNVWDGTFRNRALNPAVFVYQFNAVCRNQKTYTEKGNVTLIK